MVSITLGSFLAASMYALLKGQTTTSQNVLRTSQSLRNSERARYLMNIDILQSGFDPRYSDNPTPSCMSPRPTSSPCPYPPITTASNDRIILQGDFNMNGAIDSIDSAEVPETIDYLYDASTKQLTRNGHLFLNNLKTFSINFWDSNNTKMTNPQGNLNQIKKVRIQWSQKISDSKSENYELRVILRNFST